MDNVVVYFGVRFTLDADADVTDLETGSDPRLRAAKRERLKVWWGPLTDGEYYFLLIGAELAVLGAGASLDKSVSVDEVLRVSALTAPRLKAAGFEQEPALHFQFQAEY